MRTKTIWVWVTGVIIGCTAGYFGGRLTYELPKVDGRAQMLRLIGRAHSAMTAESDERLFADWIDKNPGEVLTFLGDGVVENGFGPPFPAAAALCGAWVEHHPDSVKSWLEAHPSSPLRDAVLCGWAGHVARQDRHEGVKLAAGITDSDVKILAARVIGKHFQRRGENVNAAFLAMGLPERDFARATTMWLLVETRLKRDAQNIASTFHAAKDAGAPINVTSLDAILKDLNRGVEGTPQPRPVKFQVDLSGLTEFERDRLKKFLKFEEGSLTYLIDAE